MKKCWFGGHFYRHELIKRDKGNFNRVAIYYQRYLGLPICFCSDTGATSTHFPFLTGKMAQLLQPGRQQVTRTQQLEAELCQINSDLKQDRISLK